MDASILALVAGAAAGIVNAMVSGVTMVWPARPPAAAFALALVFGVGITFLAAFAYVPASTVFDRQVYAQIILAGLGSGLAAAGVGAAQTSAQAQRDAVTPTDGRMP